MTDQLLTKCPHCGTTFRLTQQQLSIAGGAVRCGACYQVFHAKEHIVRTAVVEEILPPPPPPAPDPFKQSETSNEPNPYESLDWDINLDDHPDADLFSESYELPDLEKELESELKNLGFEEEENLTPRPKPKQKGSADESWAEQLLAELGEQGDGEDDEDERAASKHRTRKTDKRGSPEAELSDSFKELDGTSKNSDVFALDDEENDTDDSTDELWAKKLLDDLESEGKPKKTGRHELAIEKHAPEPAARKPASFSNQATPTQGDSGFGDLVEDAEPPARTNKQSGIDAKSSPSAVGSGALLNNLKAKAQDLELDELPDLASMSELGRLSLDKPSDPKRTFIKGKKAADDSPLILEGPRILGPLFRFLTWTVINLVLVGVLVAQYAYFNLHTLARTDAYRPYLAMLCEHLNCTMPLQVDTSQIRVSKLVVRPHATESGALVIDAIIINRAPFEQPYPVIELVFKDMSDNLVAGRRFAPRDYIRNPDVDLHRMPPETQVLVMLEILDPGRQAVNYQMNFQPAVR